MPYLLSLAATANTGSALTMTGNDQNILIASLAYDCISWTEFSSNMILPVTVASIINATILFIYYSSELFPGSSGLLECCGIVFSGNRTPEMLAQEHAYHARNVKTEDDVSFTFGRSIWSKIQIVIVSIFLVCFAIGLDV